MSKSQVLQENMLYHPANSRGSADHGWLKVNHSFSFASWYDPEKTHFGALRVLNDDTVAPNGGFPTHPHENMEIITIPLTGQLAHKDSMGNSSTIKAGEIQVMSAGNGVRHSEFNPSASEEINLFQIWIFPKKKNVEPRYDQFWIDEEGMNNQFLQLISPNKEDAGSWIHQDAWIKMTKLEKGKELHYKMNNTQNGVYNMIISGKANIEGVDLSKRDALGIWQQEKFSIKATEDLHLITFEVPMEFDF
jgi:redox-sensitive bicupin YhaK (pirin superfamily)